jgi:hypothetical protein
MQSFKFDPQSPAAQKLKDAAYQKVGSIVVDSWRRVGGGDIADMAEEEQANDCHPFQHTQL